MKTEAELRRALSQARESGRGWAALVLARLRVVDMMRKKGGAM